MDSGKKGSGSATPVRVWTPSQRAAIEHAGGDLIVSAAAGSGKTAVLAERCARLVCGQGAADAEKRCGVENLLVLTFTEAAAGEMRTRIARAIGECLKTADGDERWLRRQVAMVDRASISTLHAFCGRILRQHFHQAGVDPAFEVMDQDEARLLQEEVLEGLMAKWHRLPAGAKTGPHAVTAEGFEAFFEAYAQGREADCGHLVLNVQRMLATTADPEAFKQTARHVYRDAEKTLELYSSQTLMGQLKLVRLAAQRAYEEVLPLLSNGAMVEGLQDAVMHIQDAIELLEDKGTAAWPLIVTILTYKWMRLNVVESISDFAGLRDRTWDDIKAKFKETARWFARDPQQMVAELKALAAPLETLLAMVAEFETAYHAAKDAENRLDFADLERLALELLHQPNSQAATELRERFWHVLVDEFQDINPLQAALLHAVRHPARFDGRGNLFVVGDVKQSIYGFRLADPELFLAREKEALAADAQENRSGNARRHVALQENFRSHALLLEVMNGIFERVLTPEVAGVDYALGHALKAAADAAEGAGGETPGATVEVHLVAPDGREPAAERRRAGPAEDEEGEENGAETEEAPSAAETEARLVADRIAELLEQGRLVHQKDGSQRKIEYRDIAILLRSAKSRGMIFARALSDRGIPVHADLQSGFFDTPEVRNAVALLQVLDNPQQDIPLATTLLGPFGGLTHDDLSMIRLMFDRKEVSFAAAVEAYAAGVTKFVPSGAPPVSPGLAAQLKAFFDKLTQWREKLRGRALHEGLAEIFAESGIYTCLAALDAGPQRVANLQMLHQRALAFASFRKQGLHRFLRFIEKLRQQEEADGGEAPILSEASNVVRIMTIHKSKGLEFPVVFVSGLGGLLRLNSEGPVLLQRDLGVGLNVVDMERNIHYPSAAALRIRDVQRRALRAEELRLLYVAMTRAREGLILTGHLRKAEEVEDWRKAWRGHEGAVPEDVLLKGRRALDWLMPALVLAGGKSLKVAWPNQQGDSAPAKEAQVVVTIHGAAKDVARAAIPEKSAAAERILAGLPLNEVGDEKAIASLVQRVTGSYPFEEVARRPAVQTVSFLKTLVEDREAAEEAVYRVELDEPAAEVDAAADPATREAQTEAARQRGLATHRILELLNLTACDTHEKIDGQIAALIAARQLTQEEADRADGPGIRWFLWHSAAGARVVQAARESAGEKSAMTLRRELPFAWIGTLDGSGDAEDQPTIRGVIDLLLVNTAERRAEIVDYKTDSARLWEGRIEDYRRQMNYYMAAAGDILGMKVDRATLVFLGARTEVVVDESSS